MIVNVDGFGLLIGHLIGDYIVQNDWMASNKANPHPGIDQHSQRVWISCSGTPLTEEDAKAIQESKAWHEAFRKWHVGHVACLVHCILYTLAVWACSFWWMPWWGLAVCFAVHFPIDRWRLAGVWMRNVSGQYVFATGPLSPWSIIVVDNTFHLLTLFIIARCV